MAKILSNTGISSGSIIEAPHVSQSIDALTGVEDYDITISGSLTVTGSIYINGLSTPFNSDTLGYDLTSGKISYLSPIPNNVDTASYVDLKAGTNITINKIGSAYYISSSEESTSGFVTISSFNTFTGSYNTGSFTGSFTGSLLGTASYVNLKAGPNITINKTPTSFEISQSVSAISLNNILITASSTLSGDIEFTKYDNSTFVISQSQYPPHRGRLYENIGTTIDTIPFQIPGGDIRIIMETSTPVVFYLPTQSINIGDTIEIFVRYYNPLL